MRIQLTEEERRRAGVIQDILDKAISHKEASYKLGISLRQVFRLLKRHRASGVDGLKRTKRGARAPTNTLPKETLESVLHLITTKYKSHGHTLAAERIEDAHGLKVSKETIRQIRMREGLHVSRAKKVQVAKPMRPRRPNKGALIQIDGSLHPWLGHGQEKAVLLVAIDDATSTLMHLKFVASESFESYASFLIEYIAKHGKPQSLYTDKHSVFSINSKNPECAENCSNFAEALNILGIRSILARSAPAKGRVERANKTLQDRLVKYIEEFSAALLDDRGNLIPPTYEQANVLLAQYMKDHNKRLPVEAERPEDLHIPQSEEEARCMNHIFSLRAHRTVSRSNKVRFEHDVYQIIHQGEGRRLQEQGVRMCKGLDGAVIITTLAGEPVEYVVTESQAPRVIEGKELSCAPTLPVKNAGVYVESIDNFLKMRAIASARSMEAIPESKIPILPVGSDPLTSNHRLF